MQRVLLFNLNHFHTTPHEEEKHDVKVAKVKEKQQQKEEEDSPLQKRFYDN